MDRYLLFGGDNYYPSGGWHDFKGSFSSKQDAIQEAMSWGWDWWHIVDLMNGEAVNSRPVK